MDRKIIGYVVKCLVCKKAWQTKWPILPRNCKFCASRLKSAKRGFNIIRTAEVVSDGSIISYSTSPDARRTQLVSNIANKETKVSIEDLVPEERKRRVTKKQKILHALLDIPVTEDEEENNEAEPEDILWLPKEKARE